MKNKKAMQKYAVMGFSIMMIVSMAVLASSIRQELPGDPATDSDGGIDYFTFGVCFDNTWYHPDVCQSSSALIEQYAVGDHCESTYMSCPCTNGVCGSTTPTDSDGGIYAEVAGACTYWTTNGWTAIHDSWNSATNLFVEMSVLGNSCISNTLNCYSAIQVGLDSKCTSAIDYDGTLSISDQHFSPSYCTTSTGSTYYDSCGDGTNYEWYVNPIYPNDCSQSTMQCSPTPGEGCNAAGTACA